MAVICIVYSRNQTTRERCCHAFINSACSPEVGQEDALWLDGRLIPLVNAQFDYNPTDPLEPWHIHTDDGLLDLQFQPEGARREDKNLLIAVSRYVQPIGSFSGWVKSAQDAAPRMVERLAGVTEDHYSRW